MGTSRKAKLYQLPRPNPVGATFTRLAKLDRRVAVKLLRYCTGTAVTKCRCNRSFTFQPGKYVKCLLCRGRGFVTKTWVKWAMLTNLRAVAIQGDNYLIEEARQMLVRCEHIRAASTLISSLELPAAVWPSWQPVVLHDPYAL